MATKAQDARGEEIRAARAKKAKKSETAKKPKAASADRVVDKDTPRNDSKRAAKKGGAAAEGSLPGKTSSRKSSRGASGRAKPDSQLKRRQTRATTSPDARARRSAAKKKK
jgi:hypothetical protein